MDFCVKNLCKEDLEEVRKQKILYISGKIYQGGKNV